PATSRSEILWIAVEPGGIGMPGLIRACHLSSRPSGWTLTQAISMIRSARGLVPVVSVSKTTRGRSRGSRVSSTGENGPSWAPGQQKTDPSDAMWPAVCFETDRGNDESGSKGQGGPDRGDLADPGPAGAVHRSPDATLVSRGGEDHG